MPESPYDYKTVLMLQVFATAQLGMRLFAYGIFIFIIFDALKAIALSRPESLQGLAEVFQAMRLDVLTAYIVCAAGVGYGLLERRQKKRIIGEKGKLQKELEGKEPWRTSSGLTLTGDNPEKKR